MTDENSFPDKFPHLMSEWDPSNTHNPYDLLPGSNKRVRWLCKLGHQWETTLVQRTSRFTKCPFCVGQRVVPSESLGVKRPDLLAEWDFKKNTRDPFHTACGSNYEAYWICQLDSTHLWKARVYSRKNSGCPYCCNKRINTSNSLATYYPELVKEWDESNTKQQTEVSYGSNYRAFWVCKNNPSHKWTTVVYSRTSMDAQCPYCVRNQTSIIEQRIFLYFKAIFPDAVHRKKWSKDKSFYELDIYIPSISIGIEYDGYFHSSEEAVERDEDKNDFFASFLQLFRIREENCPQLKKDGTITSQLYKKGPKKYPEVSDHLLSILRWVKTHRLLSKGTLLEVEKELSSPSSLLAIPVELIRGTTPLDKSHSDLCLEWDYEKNFLHPRYYSKGSDEKVWWKCQLKGHSWEATISSRTRGNNCPICSNKVVILENSLATTHPHLVQEWSKENEYSPTEVSSGSDNWDETKYTSNRLAVGMSAQEYIIERNTALNERLNYIMENIDSLEGISIDKSRVRLDRLEKYTPEEAKSLSQTLYNMLPRVKLTDLLIEVSNWTGFDEHLTHASSNRPPKGEEKSIVMATIMAMGTNIGLTKMAEATPGITYHQLANAAQWRLHEDSLSKAQATLVNFQHHLSLSKYWGNGSTSSSDGMRVQVGVSSLHADANPHYGTGKGTTIYRFTSDQFSSFYTKVINTNARDAVHVIDGLLHHESELSIEEHYTDTAGYTDQVFGLSHILGFRFAPRMRDLSDSKLYVMDKSNEYLKIESILRGKINIKVIQDNYDDVLRLAHSIREGKVSASLILGKLGSYSRQNKMATALREMGRIEKTIFILDYISNETLRRRIQRGLNKGEAMNGLARALFFGKRGELRERGLQDQLQRASALNILINAITVWNTVYLTEATKILKEKGLLKEELLPHISPLGWEHINLLGEYSFDSKKVPKSNELRPLKI
ncbi:Tn3 family transposase [Rossellomorea aquimaris]|nr:Tn3 family transposase [Rossellomorea aquimaris]MCA1054190.1 Tn3 family transposase [Rossellomorea aquimaris]